MAIVTDYASTGDDWSVIEKIRSEPSKERNLVSIGDTFLKKDIYYLFYLPKNGLATK